MQHRTQRRTTRGERAPPGRTGTPNRQSRRSYAKLGKKCAKEPEKTERILGLNRISVIEGIERRGSDAAQNAEEDRPRGEGAARTDKLYQRRHKDLNAFSP